MTESSDKKTISRVIENKSFLGLDVEIIIPFYGKHSLVSALLQDVFNSVHSNRYLVTLVDDGSKNEGFASQMQKAKLPGVRCLRQKTRKGFGAAVNHALSNPWAFTDNPHKSIPYVVIIQSDVRLSVKNWLLNLGVCLESLKNEGVKMVSPMTNNPVEKIDCLKANRGSVSNDEVLAGNDFLPMYCTLCNRELFNYVGLLDEYEYPSLEALGYSLRMKDKGFKQAVCGSSWVYHEGRATVKEFEKNKHAQKILRNIKEEFEKQFPNDPNA